MYSFPNLEQLVPCLVLTVASWPAYRFLRGQVRWSGIPISLRIFYSFFVIHTVKGFSVVTEANVFLGCCFLYDPTNVGNLISGSSAFSKPSLYIWKFSVHVLLKPSLRDFEHNLTSIWNEHNCMVVWTTFFGIPFLWDWNGTELFQSCGHSWVFQTCWYIKNFKIKSFRILNRSARIPSLPLLLFIVMLPKAHLTLHSRMSDPKCMITLSWLSGSSRPFLYSSVYSCHFFLIFSAPIRSLLPLSFIVPIFAWNVPWISPVLFFKLINLF